MLVPEWKPLVQLRLKACAQVHATFMEEGNHPNVPRVYRGG